MRDPIEHKIDLRVASGADLTILSFSDREMRWIFSYDYRGEKKRPGNAPDVVNKVKLVAEYIEGILAPSFVLSMHVIIPGRLGQSYFAGVDISPGAKTYLEFTYRLYRESPTATAYRLAEICKGSREHVVLDEKSPALVRPIEFPFPIPDHLPADGPHVHVPFRLDNGEIAHFDLPTRTLR